MTNSTMKEKIDNFLEVLPTLTKDESDLIYSVIKWDDESQAAFLFAKKMFEEDEFV